MTTQTPTLCARCAEPRGECEAPDCAQHTIPGLCAYCCKLALAGNEQTRELYRYAGSRMAVAELFAYIDFGEPQRVAPAIADPLGRDAFEDGVSYAYQMERALPEPKGGRRWYSDLCRMAGVR